MWLRDGLPKELPNTRIFVYGYDTQLQGSSSVQNLTDLGLGLRTALMDALSKDVCSHGCPENKCTNVRHVGRTILQAPSIHWA